MGPGTILALGTSIPGKHAYDPGKGLSDVICQLDVPMGRSTRDDYSSGNPIPLRAAGS